MAIKQKTITINGVDYLMTTMPATAGTRHLKLLTKLLGPALASLQEKQDISIAAKLLIDNLDNVDIESMVVGLISSVTKNGMSIDFNSEFSGEYDKLFLLVKEVVLFNFGSVFTMVGIAG